MRPYTVALTLALLTGPLAFAQKKVLSYPFEFEKSFLAQADYDAYFLDSRQDSTFAIILKDNKKAEYALMNKNFKIISKVATQLENTAMDKSSVKYVGGTTNGQEYHFLYKDKSKYQLETVDFSGKKVDLKTLFELPKAEDLVVSFSDYNVYYTIAANDKTNELVFYVVDAAGKLSQKTVPFKIPEEASRKRDKLSTYLKDLKVIKNNEEPDMTNSIKDAKLFSQAGRLDFVINDGDNPTQVFTVNVPDFTTSEKFMDYSAIVSKEERGKVYVSSFMRNNIVFSLILNKRNIRIVAQDLQTGSLLAKHEINEDADPGMFALAPVTEKRMGRKASDDEVESARKLIKLLTRGTEGLMVTENKKGQYIITAGTYDLIKMSSGGGSSYQGGFVPNTPGNGNPSTMRYDPYKYVVPGSPSYTRTDARYYTTTYFRLLLDPKTLKLAKGGVQLPITDQIKDYIEVIGTKAKATNQFSIGKNQYYGYYDRESKMYVVEQISVRS